MAFLEWLIHETSLHSLVNAGSRDIYIILLLRFLRMFAYGGAALVFGTSNDLGMMICLLTDLGVLLYIRGNSGTQIGTFLTFTLLGDAIISYLLTVKADKIGRRRVLIVGSICMAVAGVVFALTTNYYVLLFAAIIGVISPGAHEIGPFRAVQVGRLALLRENQSVLTGSRNPFSHSLHPSKQGLTSMPGSLLHRPAACLVDFSLAVG